MKTRHSKIKIFFIALVSIFALIIANQVGSKALNHFKKGFYFEKYNGTDEAKKYLFKIHPMGSDVEALVQTLKNAGAIFESEKVFNEKDRKIYYKMDKEAYASLDCYYKQNGLLVGYEWKIGIVFNKDRKILAYNMIKQF